MIVIVAFVFFGALLIAIPIGHALVMSSAAGVLVTGFLPLDIVAQQMFGQTQSFPLLALPFFILAGNLMMSGKLGKNLITFASMLAQRYRGGHASTTVVGSAIFGGVSGSAVADATALGSMLIPWQKREGYPAAYTAANNASAAMIDILIPPSIPLILYSLISGASVAALFIAGVLPGLVLTAAFLIVCNVSARLRGFPTSKVRFSWKEFSGVAIRAVPALALPVLILVVLRFGFATPTEVSVLATVYAGVVSLVAYRDLSWQRIQGAVVSAGIATGVVMLVIMASAAIGWLLTYAQIPQTFAAWALATLQSPWLIILAMNGIMLVAGMFIDLPAAILLLGPIFVPLAKTIGLDIEQLGIIMVLNLGIGLFTPPVGTTLFISSSIARVSIIEASLELWPYYLASIAVLLLFSYVPALTLG
jgi:tripartite ATP-independent transporter DctM subunit